MQNDMQNKNIVLDIRGLTKRFAIPGGGMLTACDNISLRAFRGQTVGIIGESGCGKSTLVRTLLQLYPADGGQAFLNGQDILLARGEERRQIFKKIQMVFQDPGEAFNPRMKVRDILCEPLRNFGLIKRRDVRAKVAELLQMVELPVDFMDRYPSSMSGGQRQRLGIARGLSLAPDVLICDEATSALDVSVQESVCELLVKLQRERGVSILFICHDLALVDVMCNQVVVMYLGTVVERIEWGRISEKCRHPYTKALLNVSFKLDFKPGEKVEPLAGEIPSPINRPKGCPFHTRCPQCMDICRRERPVLREIEEGCSVACHLYQSSQAI